MQAAACLGAAGFSNGTTLHAAARSPSVIVEDRKHRGLYTDDPNFAGACLEPPVPRTAEATRLAPLTDWAGCNGNRPSRHRYEHRRPSRRRRHSRQKPTAADDDAA